MATGEHRIERPPDEDESISVKGEPEDWEVTYGARSRVRIGASWASGLTSYLMRASPYWYQVSQMIEKLPKESESILVPGGP